MPTAQPPETLAAEKHSRPWKSLVGMILLILLLAGGGLWLIVFAYQQWSQSKKSTTLVTMPAASAPATTPPAATPPAATPATAATTPTATAATTDAAPTATPPPVASGVPPTASTVAASAPPPPAAVEEPAPEPEAIAWPYLKITGVIGKGLRGAATINNRIVACGETVDGVEVVSVGEYGVKLEFEGETRFIKVGNTVD
jgi:hypothetical protein